MVVSNFRVTPRRIKELIIFIIKFLIMKGGKKLLIFINRIDLFFVKKPLKK
jgi:hypothetical protein